MVGMSNPERSLADFEHDGRRAFYRPSGYIEAVHLVDLIAIVLTDALRQGLTQALVSITDVRGFDSPAPSFRAWAVRRWAQTVDGRVGVAVVAKPEHLCPQKTGLIVAAEEGLQASIFTEEIAALAWLDSHQ